MPRKRKISQEDVNGLSEAQKRANQILLNDVMRDLEKDTERFEQAQQEKKQASEDRQRNAEKFEYDLAQKFGYQPLKELRKIDRDELFAIHALAAAGNVAKQFDMARCYEEPIFLKEQQYRIAANRYRRIAQNYAPAQYNLAHHYLYNPNEYGQGNEKIGFDCLQAAARAGHPLAQHDLAICYLRNIGVEPRVENVVYAYFWFKAALNAGYEKAQLGFDKCLQIFKAYDIVFDDLDFSTAEQLWDNIQEKYALKNVNFNHKSPDFFKANPKVFIKYQKNALLHENSEKHAREKFHLARCLKAGIHVAQNSQESKKWLEKSARLNYAPAQNDLAVLHYECYQEQLLEANPNQSKTNAAAISAFQWFEKAAKEGYPPAQFNLACLYKKRIGIAEHRNNDYFAFVWCMRAALQGNEAAIKLMNTTLKSLPIGTPNVYKRNTVSSIVFSRKIQYTTTSAKAASAPAEPLKVVRDKPISISTGNKIDKVKAGAAAAAAKPFAPTEPLKVAQDKPFSTGKKLDKMNAQAAAAVKPSEAAGKKSEEDNAVAGSNDSVQSIAPPQNRKVDEGIGKDKICESAAERALFNKHQALRAQGISIADASKKGESDGERPRKRVKFR